MRWIALALCGALAPPALAGGGKRAGDAVLIIDQLLDGELNANQAANRLSFSGQERFATVQLADLLKRTAEPRRRSALLETLALVATPDPEAERAFGRALGDEDIGNRLAGLRGLGRIRAVGSVAVVERQLGDKALGVRREAARALGAIGLPRSSAPLVNAARGEDDPEVRALMLVSAGRCGDKKVAPALESWLDGSSESARTAAARALCLLGSPKGQAFARKLLASKDRFERLQGVLLFEGATAKVAGPVLTPVLEDEYPPAKAAAARILYLGGDKAKLDWLVIQSFRASGEDKLPYERELETLRLTDEDRRAVLRKAGLL